MDRKAIDEHLALLGIDLDSLSVLSELRPTLEAHADEVAEASYRHVLCFEELRRFVRTPEDRERFLRRRRRYVLSLAETGPEIFEDSSRAALLHERSGVRPAWIIRFASLTVTLLAPILARAFGHDTVKAQRIIAALGARLALDTEIAVEAYVGRHEQSLSYMSEQLALESRKLQTALYKQGLTLRETSLRARVAEELASIATLVTGLAHEIGTPMSVIQGHAKMLEASVSSDDAMWRLRTIQDQIARISRILHTLLNMAHPARREPEPVELAPLIDLSISFLSDKLAQRGIAVKQSLAPGVSVLGDGERLQQLLLNLFLNAIDAMPEGGELRVELGPADGKVWVRVEDTGVGIDPEALEQIFVPFYTTKESGHGNGLGLVVCKGIARDHGGAIDVASEVGRGTVFTLQMPLSVPREEQR